MQPTQLVRNMHHEVPNQAFYNCNCIASEKSAKTPINNQNYYTQIDANWRGIHPVHRIPFMPSVALNSICQNGIFRWGLTFQYSPPKQHKLCKTTINSLLAEVLCWRFK